MNLINVALVVVILMVCIMMIEPVVELMAHISRYRAHIRKYPVTKQIRGDVWKYTK